MSMCFTVSSLNCCKSGHGVNKNGDTRSLSFQGAYNCGSMENGWAVIVRESYTPLVQCMFTHDCMAHTKTG